MSWTDTCSNCDEHRADCQCGDWNGYKFQSWLSEVKSEQSYYPLFKGRDLNEDQLKELFKMGKSPIDALNDLITLA